MKKTRNAMGRDPMEGKLDWIGSSVAKKLKPKEKSNTGNIGNIDNTKTPKRPPAQKESPKKKTRRATFIMHEDHLEKLKAFAYWERKSLTAVLFEIIENFFKDKNIKPKPNK